MQTLKLLVVDDEPMIRVTLEAALEDGGYSTQFAASAEEAFKVLDDPDEIFAAVVTDVRLTGRVTGWDVARRARELNPSMPVVYITGDSGVDWAANGVPNSILITKPFALAQVVTAVSQLLNTDSSPP
ncbi:MAG TPA: response regulator [Caulobacteraceae bacterium]|nr:response regulator [Caulobacteraceae bacterium]